MLLLHCYLCRRLSVSVSMRMWPDWLILEIHLKYIDFISIFSPGYEGKAGMISIILKPNKSLDLDKMYDQVVTSLPAYACPRFLRIQVILHLQNLLSNVRARTKRWVSSKILLSPLDHVWMLLILVNFKNKKQKDVELMLFLKLRVKEVWWGPWFVSVLTMELPFSSSARTSEQSDALSEGGKSNLCLAHIFWRQLELLPKIKFYRVNLKVFAGCTQSLEQCVFKHVSPIPLYSP